ncbi:hypothetical protein [Winogradskyella sp. 3972H.M.0a.05]|uniref:hypothetical protein n=1 Tax=Winogradskyella sp. 3972H.M.0a.05 TaxID=2950277 RepID=UPI003390FB7E
MVKHLLFFLIPFFVISQSNDLEDSFFYKEENGLTYASDLFYDYYYFDEEFSEDIKSEINKYIKEFEAFLVKNSSDKENVFSAYGQLISYYDVVGENEKKIECSEKLYSLLRLDNPKIRKRLRTLNVLTTLVVNYNKKGLYNKSLELLRENNFLENPNVRFTCYNGYLNHFSTLGKLFFETFKGLNENDKALEYGMKYLLNNEYYANIMVDSLQAKYGLDKLRHAFNNLKQNFVKHAEVRDSYFIFLDYKITTNGTSGIYPWGGSTAFDRLKSIAFYEELKKAFNR